MSVRRKDIKNEVLKYQKLFGLKDWKITIGWTMQDSDEGGEAEVSAEPEYFKAEIHFNLDKIKKKKDIKPAVIHELLHVVLSPYTQLTKHLVNKRSKKALDYAEESLASTIERWKMWNKK